MHAICLPRYLLSNWNLIEIDICVQGKYEHQFERSAEFQQQLKLKVREILTEQEWRRRKMAMRVCWTH